MKRTLKILSFVCILISITSYAYASYTTYEAEKYILKIENINEELKKIDDHLIELKQRIKNR